MNKTAFRKFARQGYTRIPVNRELPGDLETPLSTYLKLANAPYTYLLESVTGGEKWGRYSIIGLATTTCIQIRDERISVLRDGKLLQQEHHADPLAWLADYLENFRSPAVAGLPRFCGGLVGYFGYDTIRYIEPRLICRTRTDPLDCPEICLMVSEQVVIFDNLSDRLHLVVHADPQNPAAYEQAQSQLDAIAQRLRKPLRYLPREVNMKTLTQERDFSSGFPRQDFEQAVNRIKEYIVDGEVMQAVLSQRMHIPLHPRPLDLYRVLRSLNPSPYLYYLDLGDLKIVGSSPEALVSVQEQTVTMRPIAGTRPRGSNEAQDRRLETELLADPKERAEHLMLVDLCRNDLGRVACVGSVKVTERMIVERYSHVMHIVSSVSAQLPPDKNVIDVLRATFPAGTVTGAPKIRAMEIIRELEPLPRGIYAGAVGYLSWSGNMDLAITIRTALIKDAVLHLQIGAGIVADSQAPREWEETMSKGRAVFHAVNLAEREFTRPPQA